MMAAMNVTSRNKAMMSSILVNYIPSAHFSGLALVSALSPLAFKRHARHLEFFLIILFSNRRKQVASQFSHPTLTAGKSYHLLHTQVEVLNYFRAQRLLETPKIPFTTVIYIDCRKST
jgi:hypothetical protein